MKTIGLNIKVQRRKLGMTLRDLANRIDVSASFLSQVENGKTSPSLSVAKKIADALNTTVGEIIGERINTQKNHIFIKKGERKTLDRIGNGLKLEFLSTLDKHHNIEPIIHVLEENAVSGTPPYSHAGQEFIMVLKGVIKLQLGDDEFLMSCGDSIYFDSETSHSFSNAKKESAEVLCVTSPPFF